MNFIKHFKNWITLVAADDRLKSHHVSLYNALFYYWNTNRFRNPTTIFRHEIMDIAKIGSHNTYTNGLRELTQWGYIRYEPSHNPQVGSKVYLYRFDKGSEQGSSQGAIQSSKQSTIQSNMQSTNQSTEQSASQTTDQTGATYYINIPNSLNGINNLNGINGHEPNNKISDVIDGGKTNADSEAIHSPGPDGTEAETLTKTKAPGGRRRGAAERFGGAIREAVPDTLEKVQAYFLEINGPVTEAERFFNYFESNGWQVGGKTPMKDWRAAARNWILNAKNFNHNNHDHTSQPKPGRLNTGPKNYAEPF